MAPKLSKFSDSRLALRANFVNIRRMCIVLLISLHYCVQESIVLLQLVATLYFPDFIVKVFQAMIKVLYNALQRI